MKLPKEVDLKIAATQFDLDAYEVLVRDCAKVCFDEADRLRKERGATTPKSRPYERLTALMVNVTAKGYAILARYGLEPRHD